MDQIIRMLAKDAPVKAVAVSGRDLVERARQIHTLLPVATAALGRTLLAASMMGDALKEDDGAVTLRVQGGGPLGTVLAVSDSGGNVRGYVQNPHVALMEKEPGKLDVGAAVGTGGTLTVIKDLGLKEPYVGSIGLFSGEIADDLAMYFVESEQIPTACALGVLVGVDQSVTAAGGYLIQLLPGAQDAVIEKIEAGVQRVGPVSRALEQGAGPEALLREILREFD
ncbi:MAG: Hsp33 family molecular chaperone HslO, partial [Oscillospiraceae bacterium]|nr:Hsp33 family molecular chaperone HslO [Oscillospiraceae bacterium]